MAKVSNRGPTRPLSARLAESQLRTLLLEKRMQVQDARKEARILRARLFGKK